MRKQVIIGLTLLITGCNGNLDNGADNLNTNRTVNDSATIINQTTQEGVDPNWPQLKTSAWRYTTVSNADGEVMTSKASNDATDRFIDPQSVDTQTRPFLTIERERQYPSGISQSIAVFATARLACVPSCAIDMTIDGRHVVYQMRQGSSDDMLIALTPSRGQQLFEQVIHADTVSMTLPVIGASKPVVANFRSLGYDVEKMQLGIER